MAAETGIAGVEVTNGSEVFSCITAYKLPGYTSADKVNDACAANVEFVTYSPGDFKEVTDITFTAIFDASNQSDVETAIGAVASWTVTTKNGSTCTVIGQLSAAEPSALALGDTTAMSQDFTVAALNRTALGVETGPVWTSI